MDLFLLRSMIFKLLDVKIAAYRIEIFMNLYSDSLKDITEIRKTDDRAEPLTKLEMMLYWKITGK